MATVRAKIKSPDAKGYGRIFYQIIHKRVVRRIVTDIWGTTAELVSNGSVAADIKLLESIIKRLDASGVYCSDDVVKTFVSCKSRNTFEKYFSEVISNLDKKGRIGGRKTYRSTLISFQSFSSGLQHLPGDITAGLMLKYYDWLKGNGLMDNTVAFYMRHMRAVYRMMVKDGLVGDAKPFANIPMGIAKTRKRSITEAEMLRISRVDLSKSESLAFTRDLFMLSFYCMGMPFVDLAFMKKTDMKDDRIVYNRKKTGQTINLKMNVKIKTIFDRYPSAADSPYILPIIAKPGERERVQYENALRYSNQNLKKIAALAGVESNISTYTARHTWASIAKMKRIRISTISDALGHESESTTQIYLATLDNSHIDRANDLIISDF